MIGIRELKNTLSAVLRSLAPGERVAITDRGVVVARLVAADADAAPSSRYQQLLDAGRIKRAAGRSDPFANWVSLGLPPGTAAKLLDAEREERF